MTRLTPRARLGLVLTGALAILWIVPFWWMAVAALRPAAVPVLEMGSLLPSWPPSLSSLADAWDSADFPVYYLNTTVMVTGILAVQLVTVTLAAYAFARLRFKGERVVFYAFLLQLLLVPPIFIVPNLITVVDLGLYDRLLGVMAPYFVSAFGTFLLRQTFRRIPVELEEAARLDGAGLLMLLRHVYLPLSIPALTAFSIVSVTSHWNEFLWPLMVVNSPDRQVLTVGLASFTQNAESASDWGVMAAGTLLVVLPLLVAFLAFQRRFVNSFVFSGLK